MSLWSTFTALFRKDKLDAEMAEELRVPRNIAPGMSPAEARYAARRAE